MQITHPGASARLRLPWRLLSGTALLCLVALPVHAQEVSLLQAGTRIRVTSPRTGDEPFAGNVLRLVRDTLVMATEGGNALLTLPTASLARIEVSEGRDRVKWGFIGAWAGATALGLGAAVALKNEDPNGLASFVGFLAGGIAGFFIGGVGGAIMAPEQWRPLTLYRISPSAP